MCYYATTDFACGDWKWGNMKERCPRQHRIGETCGAKLIHHESVTKSRDDCKICQEIQVKQRRLQKEQDNIARWYREGSKFTASIEKAERESSALQGQIQDLSQRRPSVVAKMNGQANGLGVVQPPPGSRTQIGYTTPSTSYSGNSPVYGLPSRHSAGLVSGAGNAPPNRHAVSYTSASSAPANRHSSKR